MYAAKEKPAYLSGLKPLMRGRNGMLDEVRKARCDVMLYGSATIFWIFDQAALNILK